MARLIIGERLKAIANMVPQNARLADIGTDHAYLPAYLVQIGHISFAIAGEVHEGPFHSAQNMIDRFNLQEQVRVRFGDGLLGWSEVGGFDGIVLAAAGMSMPQGLLEQLRVGGVLVAPVVVNEKGAQQLVRVIRVSLREWQTEYLDAVHFVPLLEGTRR